MPTRTVSEEDRLERMKRRLEVQIEASTPPEGPPAKKLSEIALWGEAKHLRVPKGDEHGGEFRPAAEPNAEDNQSKERSLTRYERERGTRIREGHSGKQGEDERFVPESLIKFDDRAGRQRFGSGIRRTIADHKYGAAVTDKGQSYYDRPDVNLFLSEDGLAGAAVTPEGDLV